MESITTTPQFSEQELIRRCKLEELRNLGIDPYPAAEFTVNVTAKDKIIRPLISSSVSNYLALMFLILICAIAAKASGEQSAANSALPPARERKIGVQIH